MKKLLNIFIIILLISVSVLAAAPGTHDVTTQVTGGTIEDLSAEETAGLVLMREEEMLAHDVYIALYDVWGTPIFNNIASSELTHTEAVQALLEAYGIEDPLSADTEAGIYENEELTALYTALVEQGSNSLLDAFIVGATVEDLDIKDLNELLSETDNEDLIMVYENLRKGSRNHMRSFIKQIESNDGTYEAQYISEEELLSIIGGSQETGPLLTSESNIDPQQLQKNMQRGRTTSATGQQNQAAGRLGAGNYAMANGRQLQVQENTNGLQLGVGNTQARTNMQVSQARQGDRLVLNTQLSNGRNSEIKIMPDVASERAMERLQLNTCSEENDCQIELRETGRGTQTKAVYEVQAQKQAKVFGVFNAQMRVRTQIDAETGDILKTNKAWWSFLASEE